MTSALPDHDGPLHERGTGLGIAGQACFLGTWIIGLLSAIGRGDLAILALVSGVTGLVLTIIACFLVRRRFGAPGPIAAWCLIGGAVLGAVLFLGIPGSGAWGKLGALLYAMAALALAIVLGHLFMSIGLVHAGLRGLGGAGIALQSATLLLGAATFSTSEGLGFAACATSFLGHVIVLIGLHQLRGAPEAPA